MAFTNKTEQAATHVKLTAIGRQLLAQGQLTFAGFAVGDSEVDYASMEAASLTPAELQVLRPVDAQPTIKWPILAQPGDAGFIAPLSGKIGQEVTIQNTAPSRGPFRRVGDGPLNLLDITLPSGGKVSVIKGYTTLQASGTASLTVAAALPIAAGDFVLIHWVNSYGSTPTISGNTYAIGDDSGAALLLYRVVSYSGTTLVLDRPTPRVSETSNAFILPGGDAINDVYGSADPVAFWNEDTLGFEPTPPVTSATVGMWNLNIVYGESVLGTAAGFQYGTYPSNSYGGLRRYLGYSEVRKPIALLHYSNHVVHNLYGESLKATSVKVTLPTVLWWGQSEGKTGLVCVTDTDRNRAGTTTATGHVLIYHHLMDEDQRLIGRVYPALKLITLDDPELVAAVSAKSNRNWTLPPFNYINVGGVPSSSSNQSIGLGDGVSKELHVTYALETDATGTWAEEQGYGYQPALPCQYIKELSVSLSQLRYLEFKLSESELQHLQDADSVDTALGGGFTAQRLVLLFQEVNAGSRPAPDAWIRLDVTSRLAPAVTSGHMLKRSALGALYQIPAADFVAARANALANGFYTLPAMGASGGLTFGEETYLLGNVDTDIEALVFRTSFLLDLPEGAYATSSNPTWTSGDAVAITEIGIYDSFNNLVAAGKPSDPFVKTAATPLYLDATLDF